MNKTGILFFPAFDWAISPSHPEREERLLYTRDQLFEEGIMDFPQIIEYQPRLATFKDIARVHFCVPNIPAQITEAHLVAAGGALVVADAKMKNEIHNGFAIIRPPGHHAMTVSHGNRGFCNINNEAIMIEYLRHTYGIKRVAVVDTDVHHGDGTQDIFYNDPDVLFISFHQDGRTLYPGTGFTNELGGPLAWGTNINVPLAPGTTDAGIIYVLENLVLPLLEQFKPELVINSAGQDNHYSDPLANMRFSAQGYATLNQKLAPDLAVLEGGYSVETALPYVNMGIIMAMAGIDFSNLSEPDYRPEKFRESPANMEYIKKLVSTQLQNFARRDEIVDQNRQKHDTYYSYYKSIFYDTDYISEEQSNKLYMCKNCCGLRLLDSTAHMRNGQVQHVFCIAVPDSACPSCQQEARSIYTQMTNGNHNHMYDVIYLQDRIADEYRSYNTGSEKETII